MDSEKAGKAWRALAIGLCAAIPVSFYALGDLADAFPGVLTLERPSAAAQAGPPAQGEDLARASAEPLVPAPASEALADLAAGLSARIDALAADPVIGGNLAVSVVDAQTGEAIVARDADAARIPASTLKLLTAAAVLRVLPGETTLTTSAMLKGDTMTLVGTGDMTLTDAKLGALADAAAAMVLEGGARPIALRLDTSALPGGENPAWGGNGRAGGWVAPTAALAVDEGRLDASPYGAKSADPAGDAAQRFAQLLRERGVEVSGEIAPGIAPPTGRSVQVESAPLEEIVQTTLLHSDNTLAELLAHLVARAHGLEPTPANAAAAVDAEVRALGAELGVPGADLAQLVIRDGSGLSLDNRVSPVLQTAVLGRAASGSAPALEPLLYDVPIGGLSGTLAERFSDPGVAPARGVIRGKTGYLGGTAALAGVTALPDGGTVAFDIIVHGFPPEQADEARAAVDRVAAEIVETS